MSLKSVIKSGLFAATGIVGLQALMRHRHRRRPTVLCYHGVVAADRSSAGVRERHAYRNTVAAAEFDRQMVHLRAHYSPVTPRQVIDWAVRGADLPERAVLITFDDGYRNNLEHALPILQRHGIPALVSVATDYVGTERLLWPTEVEMRVRGAAAVPVPGREQLATVPAGEVEYRTFVDSVRGACKRLPAAELARYLDDLRAATDIVETDPELTAFLDWDQVRELAGHGVTIASHTASHPILTRLSADELAGELVASRQRIEQETGAPCTCLVYPNGGAEDYSPQVVAAAAAAGYEVAFRLTNGCNPEHTDEPFAIDRVDVPGQALPGAFDVRVCGLYSGSGLASC